VLDRINEMRYDKESDPMAGGLTFTGGEYAREDEGWDCWLR